MGTYLKGVFLGSLPGPTFLEFQGMGSILKLLSDYLH